MQFIMLTIKDINLYLAHRLVYNIRRALLHKRVYIYYKHVYNLI